MECGISTCHVRLTSLSSQTRTSAAFRRDNWWHSFRAAFVCWMITCISVRIGGVCDDTFTFSDGTSHNSFTFVIGNCFILAWRVFDCCDNLGGSGGKRPPYTRPDSCSMSVHNSSSNWTKCTTMLSSLQLPNIHVSVPMAAISANTCVT